MNRNYVLFLMLSFIPVALCASDLRPKNWVIEGRFNSSDDLSYDDLKAAKDKAQNGYRVFFDVVIPKTSYVCETDLSLPEIEQLLSKKLVKLQSISCEFFDK